MGHIPGWFPPYGCTCAITISPLLPQAAYRRSPMRTKVSAPHRESSSMAMEADGPPIPVDVTLTFTRPGSCICDIFSVVCNENRVVKILGNFHTPFRVSRHDHIPANFPLCNLDMILPAGIFRIVFHSVTSVLYRTEYLPPSALWNSWIQTPERSGK